MDVGKIRRPYAGLLDGDLRPIPVVDALELAGAEVFYSGIGDQSPMRCPTPEHDDNNPSASVNTCTGLWYCHGCGAKGNLRQLLGCLLGGDAADVLAARVAVADGSPASARRGEPALGWPPAEADFEPSPTELGRKYVYEYAPGDEAYTVARGYDRFPGAPRFTCSRPTRAGGRAQNLPPREQRVPYRLPELKAADPADTVYVVEGEKDAEAIVAAGGLATTSANGANGWRAGWGQLYLGGRHVVIVADRDDGPGIRAALERHDDIAPHAASCRIVGARVGKDAADHLYNGFGLGDFAEYAPPESQPADRPAEGPRPYTLTPLSAVKMEPVSWLWEGWVPDCHLTLLAGDGGVGKSTFVLGMAARLSRGELNGGEAGTTLLLSAEDSLTSAVVPRLVAAGAVRDRVQRLQAGDGCDLTFPGGTDDLAQAIRDTGAKLVILDPGNGHLDVQNSHADVDLRRALGPLARVAEQERCAIVYLIHLNKGSGTFRQRINGSVGTINQARSVLGMAADPDAPDDRVVLAHVKHNLSARQQSLVFERELVDVEADDVSLKATRLTKYGPSSLTADDLVAPAAGGPTKRERAADFLAAALEDGPARSKDVNLAAFKAGIKEGTLAAARKDLGVEARKAADGWMLGLPGQFDADD